MTKRLDVLPVRRVVIVAVDLANFHSIPEVGREQLTAGQMRVQLGGEHVDAPPGQL